jgi:hypothetical protein
MVKEMVRGLFKSNRGLVLHVWLLLALLAACGVDAPTTDQPAGGDVTVSTVAAPALQPVTPDLDASMAEAYPYPEPATAGALPTGYPGEIIPGPPVDLIGGEPGAYPGGSEQTAATIQSQRPATPPAELASLITAIARDLNRQTDTPMDEIIYLAAEPMTWPNTGLGCPDPDLAYAEVIVEGYLITMAVGERTFDYHTDTGANYVFCRDGQPLSSGSIP